MGNQTESEINRNMHAQNNAKSAQAIFSRTNLANENDDEEEEEEANTKR